MGLVRFIPTDYHTRHSWTSVAGRPADPGMDGDGGRKSGPSRLEYNTSIRSNRGHSQGSHTSQTWRDAILIEWYKTSDFSLIIELISNQMEQQSEWMYSEPRYSTSDTTKHRPYEILVILYCVSAKMSCIPPPPCPCLRLAELNLWTS